MNMPMEIFTDGSCLNNPGPGGYAFIIRYWEDKEDGSRPEVHETEKSLGYRSTTNNRMEIQGGVAALIEASVGLKTGIFKNVPAIKLATDSKYVCDAVNRRWIDKWRQNNWITSAETPVKNRDLWEALTTAMDDLRNLGVTISFEHVLGHNGHEFNERCDKLAVAAAKDATNHLIDEVYEKSKR